MFMEDQGFSLTDPPAQHEILPTIRRQRATLACDEGEVQRECQRADGTIRGSGGGVSRVALRVGLASSMSVRLL